VVLPSVLMGLLPMKLKDWAKRGICHLEELTEPDEPRAEVQWRRRISR
jgi:hypothetical protein